MENCHNTHLEKMLKMVSLKLQEREFSEDGYKQCMEWRVGQTFIYQFFTFLKLCS